MYYTLHSWKELIHMLHAQLTNQRQLIVSQFGFSAIQTTLIGCVDGVVESGLRAFRRSVLWN